MARKGTRGYKAQRAREMGTRRIKRLEHAAKYNITERTEQWINSQIKEIKSAMQGTRQYSKSGKRYKSKTASYIDKQIQRLERAVKEVPQYYTLEGDSFTVTQAELNKASVNKPSIYTKTEAKLFYRVTQKIWQSEDIGEHHRNEAILDYYNSIREQNGLSPLRLDQIVDYVLDANREAQDTTEFDPSEYDGIEESETYNNASKGDNADSDYGSPPGIDEQIVQDIMDAMEELFVTDISDGTSE